MGGGEQVKIGSRRFEQVGFYLLGQYQIDQCNLKEFLYYLAFNEGYNWLGGSLEITIKDYYLIFRDPFKLEFFLWIQIQ